MLLDKNIPFKYVFGKIRLEVIIVGIYAAGIAVLYSNFHVTRISIPIAVPMILGTVISLLLGFRSNQAYDRWWEARIIWGAIVNDSRTFARQLLTFMQAREEQEEMNAFRSRLVRRQIAWTYCLGNSLRHNNPLDRCRHLLSEQEMGFISRYNNKPNALLELHGHDLKLAHEKGWINDFQQVELDETLSRLCDSMGKCERIKNTIFPATYSVYIHLSLMLFILLLPFGLIEFFGAAEVPLVIAIASSFLLIEKMAIHLQDPFENKPTDTPVTTIASNIERDLKQMMKDKELPEPVQVESFYLM